MIGQARISFQDEEDPNMLATFMFWTTDPKDPKDYQLTLAVGDETIGLNTQQTEQLTKYLNQAHPQTPELSLVPQWKIGDFYETLGYIGQVVDYDSQEEEIIGIESTIVGDVMEGRDEIQLDRKLTHTHISDATKVERPDWWPL